MRDALLGAGFDRIVLCGICHNCRITVSQKIRHLVSSKSINGQANVAGDVSLTDHWYSGNSFWLSCSLSWSLCAIALPSVAVLGQFCSGMGAL